MCNFKSVKVLRISRKGKYLTWYSKYIMILYTLFIFINEMLAIWQVFYALLPHLILKTTMVGLRKEACTVWGSSGARIWQQAQHCSTSLGYTASKVQKTICLRCLSFLLAILPVAQITYKTLKHMSKCNYCPN